jgi:signal transduction histidine kinase/DNA-binding NarL/FixJ family response regulator
MLHKLLKYLFVLVLLLGIGPILAVNLGFFPQFLDTQRLATANFVAWAVVLYLLIGRAELSRVLHTVGKRLGVETRFSNLDELLEEVLRQVERKHAALQIHLLERPILSKEELSQGLERVVSHAFKLFKAESAELALFDRDAGLFHSAFVLGKPFRTGTQALLAQASEGGGEMLTSPDVLVQPVVFAGTMLGSLRVGLTKGEIPNKADRELLRLLGIEAGLAILNSQYSETLMRMKQVSDESVRAKTGFLANLSHEIRGPLGIMLNAVELVLDGLCGDLTPDQKDTLRTNGEHLLGLINDVLDYAKAESGVMRPEPTDVSISELLQEMVNVVRTQADSKEHRILFFKQEQEKLIIHVDRRHIRQMMINLLTNAIKYTPAKGTIEVWAERIPGNMIKINVRDNGVGIDPSQRHKVFAAFERVEDEYSSNQAGTGLGMPLTKRLAEVNGGSVDFSSRPREETHFWLTFPAIENERNVETPVQAVEPEVVGRGELILLVEKNQRERDMIRRYLEHRSFRVSPAGSGPEALDIIRQREVDLVIIDNDVVDDLKADVIKDIRAAAGSLPLHIILMSSRGFVFDIEKYLRAGVDRCLTKPVPLKTLAKICRDIIDGISPPARLEAAPAPRSDKKQADQASHRVINVDDVLH